MSLCLLCIFLRTGCKCKTQMSIGRFFNITFNERQQLQQQQVSCGVVSSRSNGHLRVCFHFISFFPEKKGAAYRLKMVSALELPAK